MKNRSRITIKKKIHILQKNIYVCIISFLILLASCDSSDYTPLVSQTQNTVNSYFVYKNNQKYSKILIKCIIIARGSCSLNTLPFIGFNTHSLDSNDIMNRLIVSHSWMGKRFEEFLAYYPKEALSLFRSITAIVIGSNIKPSHYKIRSSVIYLNPEHLWLSQTEYNSIPKKKIIVLLTEMCLVLIFYVAL